MVMKKCKKIVLDFSDNLGKLLFMINSAMSKFNEHTLYFYRRKASCPENIIS